MEMAQVNDPGGNLPGRKSEANEFQRNTFPERPLSAGAIIAGWPWWAGAAGAGVSFELQPVTVIKTKAHTANTNLDRFIINLLF